MGRGHRVLEFIKAAKMRDGRWLPHPDDKLTESTEQENMSKKEEKIDTTTAIESSEESQGLVSNEYLAKLIYKPVHYDRKVLCEIPLEMQYSASVKVEKNQFRQVYEVVLYTAKEDLTI